MSEAASFISMELRPPERGTTHGARPRLIPLVGCAGLV